MTILKESPILHPYKKGNGMSVYTVTLYWKDVCMGDYLDEEQAEHVISDWISECEDEEAKDRNNYRIEPYKED